MATGADVQSNRRLQVTPVLGKEHRILRSIDARRNHTAAALAIPRLLIAHTDQRVVGFLVAELREDAYRVQLEASGMEALARILDSQPHAVILDVTLPDSSGISLCGAIRERSSVPVLFLSAQADLQTRLRAFEAGADDFLAIPFSAAEVLARLKAMRRRAEHNGLSAVSPGGQLQVDGLRLDPASHEACLNSRHLPLTPIEFAVLQYLMAHAGEAVHRQDLLDTVWGINFIPGSNVIDRHIRSLRVKLASTDRSRFIETLPHVGYRLRVAGGPPEPVKRA